MAENTTGMTHDGKIQRLYNQKPFKFWVLPLCRHNTIIFSVGVGALYDALPGT